MLNLFIMNKLLFLCCMGLLALTTVVSSKGTPLQENPPDFFDMFLNNGEVYQRVIGALVSAFFLGKDVLDPYPFHNFTFYPLSFMEGIAHTYNPALSGLSKVVRNLSMDGRTVKVDVFIPKATFLGEYDIAFYYPPGGHSYEGAGLYNHTFYNITYSANYTLSQETERVKASELRATYSFESCSLWAEKYKEDGELVTDWKQRSEQFKNTFEFYEWLYRYHVLAEEAHAYILNVSWGFGHLRYTMQDVIRDHMQLIEQINNP